MVGCCSSLFLLSLRNIVAHHRLVAVELSWSVFYSLLHKLRCMDPHKNCSKYSQLENLNTDKCIIFVKKDRACSVKRVNIKFVNINGISHMQRMVLVTWARLIVTLFCFGKRSVAIFSSVCWFLNNFSCQSFVSITTGSAARTILPWA